jgi:putative Mg2+ transporter-C (MgtC) family protein
MSQLDLLPLTQTLVRMVAAFALALPLGWERERADRSAGLRTFPLVAVAACSYILLANAMFEDARAQARVLEGVITGVGFLGGGAILKDADRVRGTATAASIWATAGIGAAAGYGRYDIAILLSVICLGTLRLLLPLKNDADESSSEDAAKK